MMEEEGAREQVLSTSANTQLQPDGSTLVTNRIESRLPDGSIVVRTTTDTLPPGKQNVESHARAVEAPAGKDPVAIAAAASGAAAVPLGNASSNGAPSPGEPTAERTKEVAVTSTGPAAAAGGSGCAAWMKGHKVLVGIGALLLVSGIAVGVAVPLATSGGDDDDDIQGGTWTQFGTDFEGPTEGDEFGASLRLGGDPKGTRMSIIAREYDAVFEGDQNGLVRVYDVNGDGTLSQVGRDFIGANRFDRAVGMISPDGKRLLIFSGRSEIFWEAGAEVFELTPERQWTRLGDKIVGFFRGAFSGDGNVFVMGSYYYGDDDIGRVRVQRYVNGGWSLWGIHGADLTGIRAGSQFGRRVAVSGDGRTVAVGSNRHDSADGENDIGHVRVLRYQDGEWKKLGQDFFGESKDDDLGGEVELSATGNRLAIGITGLNVVKVYELKINFWEQMGSTIDSGSTENVGFGGQIKMSENGIRMAIGSFRYSTSSASWAGRAQVFEYRDDDWKKLGQDIIGTNNCEGVGTGMSISADGSRLAIGSPSFAGREGWEECEGYPKRKGFVRIYDLVEDE